MRYIRELPLTGVERRRVLAKLRLARRYEAGLCRSCGAPRLRAPLESEFCLAHFLRRRLDRRRRAGCKPYQKGRPGRPPVVPGEPAP